VSQERPASGEDLVINRVGSATVHVPGRSLNTARTNHFVIDEPASAGGPEEAITPAESFLAGISACGVLLVPSFARQEGVPLEHAEAAIDGVRRRDDLANFRRIDLRFTLAGPSQVQAERLVESYKGR
jgi:uncharacterized OsmC-like protein